MKRGQRSIRRAPLTVLDYDRLLSLWQTEITKDEMIAALNTTRRGIEQAKADLRLPHRSSRKSWHKPHTSPKKPDPDVSEEEMRHRMAKVQATWTDEMFVLRSQGRVRPLPYSFPVYSLEQFFRG